MRGTKVIYAKILKVGYDDDREESPLMVRVSWDEQTIELPANEQKRDLLFDLAKSRAWARIRLMATWERIKTDAGPLRLVIDASEVIDVSPWHPVTGAEAIELIHAAAPSLGERAEQIVADLGR